MAVRFIDANIFLRLLTGSDPVKAAAAKTLLLRVESGEEKATTSPLVLFEVIFTLHSRRSYNQPKERVVELVSPLLMIPGLQIPSRQAWLDTFSVWLKYPIDFTDAYNVVLMRAAGLTEIYAWDTDYDQVPDIIRIEPTADEQVEEAA